MPDEAPERSEQWVPPSTDAHGITTVTLPYSPTGYGFRLKNEGRGNSLESVQPGSVAERAGLAAGMRILACDAVDVAEDPGFERIEELIERAAQTGRVVLHVTH